MLKRLIIAVGLVSSPALSQTPPITNPLDGVTPHALKPAEPSSTFDLGNIDTVNIYNGSVSVRLPLLQISGRGEVSHTVAIGIDPPAWSVSAQFSSTDIDSTNAVRYAYFNTVAELDLYDPTDPGYGPGILEIKRSGSALVPCTNAGGGSVFSSFFTHLVYKVSGGTQYQLFDTKYGGNGILSSDPGTCGPSNQSQDRGTTFQDRDNVGLMFVSNASISDTSSLAAGDQPNGATDSSTNVSGTLYFRDGSRAVIDNGRTIQKIDRHGNTITFCYSPCMVNPDGTRTSGGGLKVDTIIDAIGRVYQFAYNVNDNNYGIVDTITYRANGDNGDNHIIRIAYQTDGGATLSGFGPSPAVGIGAGTTAQRPVKIFLPNASPANPSYQFTYDSYMELQSITLPTGAVISYAYDAGVDCGSFLNRGCYASGQLLEDASTAGVVPSTSTLPVGPNWRPVIYRRLITRTEKSDGATVSRTTQISRPEKVTNATSTPQHLQGTSFGTMTGTFYSTITVQSTPYVTVTESGTGLSTVSTNHYFFAYPDSNLIFDPAAFQQTGSTSAMIGPANEILQRASNPLLGYPSPYPSKEYRTEVANAQGIDRVFGPAGTGIGECQANTTLKLSSTDAGQTSGKVSAFDSSGNESDTYEFDFGSAPSIATVPSDTSNYLDYRTCPVPSALSNYVRHTKKTFTPDSTYVPPPSHLLSLLTQVQVVKPSTGGDSIVSEVDFSYDGSNPSDIPGLLNWTMPRKTDGTRSYKVGNVTQVSQWSQDLWTETGFTSSSATVTESRSYDNAGNITTVTDRNGNLYQYDWSDNCTGAKPAGIGVAGTGGTLGAFLHQITFPAPRNSTAAQTQAWSYDCHIGRPLSFTDRTNGTLQFGYEKSGAINSGTMPTSPCCFDRLLSITRQTDGSQKNFNYTDPVPAPATPLAVETRSDVLYPNSDRPSQNDQKGYVKLFYDGFGRPIKTQSGGSVSGTEAIETVTDYDGLGRGWKAYDPRVVGNASSYKQTAYDALGRVVAVSNTADNSSVTTCYEYGNVFVTDERGNVVEHVYDGLGRLAAVVEDPTVAAQDPCFVNGRSGTGYITTYTYDILDNLKSVTQTGGSFTITRSFEYDALKRLRKATNPENGVSRYQYDGNGNLTNRVEGSSPDQTTMALTYDALNRLTQKQYTDPANNSANGMWCYDGQTFAYDSQSGALSCTGSAIAAAAGKLTGYGSKNSSMKFEYDSSGRISASEQRTPVSAPAYRFVYSYYANDSIATETYPSQRALTNCYDGLGRPSWVSGAHTSADCVNGTAVPATQAYASGIAYAPHGAMQHWQLGSNLYEQTCFNSRLQPVGIRVGSGITSATNTYCANAGSDPLNLSFDYYGSGQDNGNVMGQAIGRGSNFAGYQYYGYDSLNRLAFAAEYGAAAAPSTHPCSDANLHWCEGYSVDQFGNRQLTSWSQNITAPDLSPTGFNSKNQMTTAQGGGTFGFDQRGNLKQNAGSGTQATFGYDAENRQVAYCAAGGTCSITTPGAIVYTYDAAGLRVGKSGTTYVYDARNQLAAEYGSSSNTSGSQYLTADHLGSVRLITDGSGNVLTCKDYSPYGGEIPATSSTARSGACWSDSAETLRFTGKERDAETGLDYFAARYFSAGQGRWTSPDWSEKPQPIPYANLRDPQTLNLYSYVRNNPMSRFDPDGHCCFLENLKTVGQQSLSVLSRGADQIATVANATGQLLSENPDFSFSRITSNDLNNIGKNLAAAVAFGEAAPLGLSEAAEAKLTLSADVPPVTSQGPVVGETVYRVWGGDAGPYGRSWTPVNPETVPNYRSAAGLPDANSGTQMTTGTLKTTKGVIVRPAKPLDGNPGGLKEYVVPDPKTQVDIKSIKLKEEHPNR